MIWQGWFAACGIITFALLDSYLLKPWASLGAALCAALAVVLAIQERRRWRR